MVCLTIEIISSPQSNWQWWSEYYNTLTHNHAMISQIFGISWLSTYVSRPTSSEFLNRSCDQIMLGLWSSQLTNLPSTLIVLLHVFFHHSISLLSWWDHTQWGIHIKESMRNWPVTDNDKENAQSDGDSHKLCSSDQILSAGIETERKYIEQFTAWIIITWLLKVLLYGCRYLLLFTHDEWNWRNLSYNIMAKSRRWQMPKSLLFLQQCILYFEHVSCQACHMMDLTLQSGMARHLRPCQCDRCRA